MYKSILKTLKGDPCTPFTYANAIQALATTVTATPQINFSNDSDFIVNEIRGIVLSTGIPDASILLTLSLSSGELFSNVAINVLSFATVIPDVATTSGLQGYPIRLPEGIRIPANSQLNLQLQNNSADTVNVQIQFIGYKVEKLV